MQWLILFLVGATGGLIFYQDLKTRTVSWLLFPIIAIGGIWYQLFYRQSAINLLKTFSINAGFLIIQYLLLFTIFSLKKGVKSNLIGNQIGWGDVFLLVSCAFFFSPLNFLLFFILSLGFVLCLHLIFKKLIFLDDYHQTVPLAGFQVGFLFIYLMTTEIIKLNLTNDDWIFRYIANS